MPVPAVRARRPVSQFLVRACGALAALALLALYAPTPVRAADRGVAGIAPTPLHQRQARELLITVRPIPAPPAPDTVVRYSTGRPDGVDNRAERAYATGPAARFEQRIRVLEGQPARIEIGTAEPVVSGDIWLGTGTATGSVGPTTVAPPIAASLRYREVTSGFDVIARTKGDRVTLTIRAHREHRAETGGGAFDQERIATTVRGTLGQWIRLGDTGPETAPDTAVRRYSTDDTDAALHGFEVRVTALPAPPR